MLVWSVLRLAGGITPVITPAAIIDMHLLMASAITVATTAAAITDTTIMLIRTAGIGLIGPPAQRGHRHGRFLTATLTIAITRNPAMTVQLPTACSVLDRMILVREPI